jgi:hypothetical protein
MSNLLAIFTFLLFGHFLRYFRWQMLLDAIGAQISAKIKIGYGIAQSLNIFLPFKLGDAFRIYFSSSNSTWLPMIFSVLIIERIADIFVVASLVKFMSMPSGNFASFVDFLIILSGIFLVIFAIFGTRIWVLRIDFHSKIGRTLALCSLSLRRTLVTVNWFKFGIVTILMWSCYLGSLLFLTNTKIYSEKYSVVFALIYMKFTGIAESLTQLHTLVFFFSALTVVFLLFFKQLPKKIETSQLNEYLLSKMENRIDTREKILISTSKNEYIRRFFKGGSSALTVLVENSKSTPAVSYVRKITWGNDDAELLRRQFDLIDRQINKKYFPKVQRIVDEKNCFVYDMTYFKDAQTLGDEIQTQINPKETVNNVLDAYFINFPEVEPFGVENGMSEYLATKLRFIENVSGENDFSEAIDKINEKIDQLKMYGSALNMSTTNYSVHGDLSLGNILIDKHTEIVFIDLLPQKLGLSRAVDLGKLLFSMRSGYENFNPNLDFLSSGSEKLLKSTATRASLDAEIEFKRVVCSKHGKDMWEEIEFHAKIHSLRILPYKYRNDRPNYLCWLLFTFTYLERN